jgi:hypothetical protein
MSAGAPNCFPRTSSGDSHVGVAVGRLVDLGVVDDEEDLRVRLVRHRTSTSTLRLPKIWHIRSWDGGG